MTERTCQCGCGRSLEDHRPQAKYFDDTCKQTAYRNRHAGTVTPPAGEATSPGLTVSPEPERTAPVMNNRRSRRAATRRAPVTEAHNTVAELRTGKLFTQASPEELAANAVTHAGHAIHPHNHNHIPPQYRSPQRCSSRWWCETCKTWFTDINCYQKDT